MSLTVEDRENIIVKTSAIGIAVNILLAGFKALVGYFSNSIAIILDALNNLTDSLSSIITIIGARLAGKTPDREHPLGHGRVEYLSAMIVSVIVIYAGIMAMYESIKKIISPEAPDYSYITLAVLVIGILTKLVLSAYVQKKGEEVDSGALKASGVDARSDALLSASVLACAILYMATGVSLEAYVGVVIAIFILRTAYEMMTDTLDDILGRRADPETTRQIKELLNEEPEVFGAYDLFINNYGPDRNYASVHLELPDNMTVREVDELTRRVSQKVYRQTGVILTAVGVYSNNASDDEIFQISKDVEKIVTAHDWALQMHGFYADSEKKQMRFDVVLSFDIQSSDAIRILCEEIRKKYPDYQIMITPDIDITDI